ESNGEPAAKAEAEVQAQAVTEVQAQAETESEPSSQELVAETQAANRHHLRMDYLRPSTRYSYEAQAVDGERAGSILAKVNFITAPVTDRTPLRFAAVGDSGGMPWWFRLRSLGADRIRSFLDNLHRREQWRVARSMAACQPQFFQHLGDI